MSRKTGTKWKTSECGRCGEPHEGYSGKLNAENVEYVVCGITGKPMVVNTELAYGNSFAFPTYWTKEEPE
jgi:hypothetical protein